MRRRVQRRQLCELRCRLHVRGKGHVPAGGVVQQHHALALVWALLRLLPGASLLWVHMRQIQAQ